MKKLPIGIQSFKEIISDNYYYVDKTHFVKKLEEEGKYYFLSRPRRFGKSLFLDTLKQAFLGKKELFQGLYLEKNWDWTVNYPVIHIDFGGGVVSGQDDLKKWILFQLKRNEENLGVKCDETEDYRNFFEEFILKINAKYKQKVVILIDEYDKPILDRIEEKEEAKKIREVLKNFYSVIKPLDASIKFVFFTGVSKFSKVSLFSGLNQLQDITLNPQYATICGYTQQELENVFQDRLKEVNLETVKCWYNGYSFLGEAVYNPFDILLYLSEKQFRPFWFETGTPSFLIKLLVEKKFYIPELEGLSATENLIGSFDIDFVEPENLLFQTGYLTIKSYEPIPTGLIYYLGFPNKEVKVSLGQYLISYLTRSPRESNKLISDLYDILRKGEIKKLEKIFSSLFASIPYEWYRSNTIANYEGYYASVVYSFLAGAGLEMVAEDYTNSGRIDLTLLYEDKCFILEFKVIEKEGEEKAIEQIKKKAYSQKYVGKVSEIYLIGIDFSKEKKSLVHFDWEKVER